MRRSIAPWAALAGSLALTASVAAFVLVNGRTRDRVRFARAIREVSERIQGRLDVYEAMLRGCAGLVAARPDLYAEEFRTYVDRLDLEQRYPGVQGVGYARRVGAADKPLVEADLTRRGFARGIWPPAWDGERTAVVFLEPLDRRNRAALGYDMFTDAARREAMQRARDGTQVSMSGKVTLVQELEDEDPGFLVYVPVYRNGAAPQGVQARRDALLGWMYAPFRARDFFVSLFADETEQAVEFQVFDGGTTAQDSLLFDRGLVPDRGERLAEIDRLAFGGREWTLSFVALPGVRESSAAAVAAAILIGAAISALIFVLSVRESAARARAEGAIAGLQRSLDEQRRYEQRLHEESRRKDEFLAVLGHELRNPLAPVVTALEVIRRDRSAIDRQLAIIERQARHMVRIVDELLDVSRISRGKIELRKQRLSVRDALARAADSISPMARSRALRLTVSFPPRPLSVEADPVRLEQILGNLLSNAIKYTPEGGDVELSAREKEGQLELRVHDTGIGIPAEALGTLFDPFVQVPGAKDFAKGGLGIGLSLVRSLVELHGGTVRAESEGPGKGSTFLVLLPCAIESATPKEMAPLSTPAQPGRVLVVDDNVDAASTLAEAVRLDGHEVRVAHDGPSSLREARDFAPEVVLLDIGLPGMDGYEVARRMRELAQTRSAYIVALTGFGQESDRQRALASGFDEHLVKPVDLDTVTAVLRRRLGAA